MLIIGAGGHAKEVYEVIKDQYSTIEFFDEFDLRRNKLYNHKINHSLNQAKANSNTFVLGIGGEKRQLMVEKAEQSGFEWCSVKSSTATFGEFDVKLDLVDIMQGVWISNNVAIEKGTLVNRIANIHHDCQIGKFCEVGPGTTILGGVTVGDNTMIGAMSTILPKVKIGRNVTVGAGSVVLKNIEDNMRVAGNPAKPI